MLQSHMLTYENLIVDRKSITLSFLGFYSFVNRKQTGRVFLSLQIEIAFEG